MKQNVAPNYSRTTANLQRNYVISLGRFNQ